MKILRIKKLVDYSCSNTVLVKIDVYALTYDELKEVKRLALYIALSVKYFVEDEEIDCILTYSVFVRFLMLLSECFDVTI